MMLDIKTILVVTLASASLQAIAWIFVWRAWRNLYELKFLAAGFSVIAVGLLMMILRGEHPAAWSVVLHNTIIKLGLVLLADGLARFLGQPRHTWLGITLLIFQIVTWSIALTVDPSNLAIRVHTSTLFTVTMMSVMCLALARDQTQPRFLRWATIGVLAEYMVASLIHSALEVSRPAIDEGIRILNDHNAWYLLQGTLFLIALFACLLFMVSWRLSSDLREKNGALSREVLERRRLESQLSASLETERSLREEQADFMRIVSHEFRTPLTIIRNGIEMIRLTGTEVCETTRERLSDIDKALGRMFSLIDHFMTNDNDNGFQPEVTQAVCLMNNVRLHFEMISRDERLDFRAHGLETSVFVDLDMLTTVLINLIDNALKYSSENQSVHVEMRAECGRLLIHVRDSGIGIPKEELHKIGRRFFRASNAETGTGYGLGLYSCHRLLSYHRGSLELFSNEERGTTAVVQLPLIREAAISTQPEEQARGAHTDRRG